MILSSKNQHQLAANMVFNLAVGFHDIELANIHKEDARGSVRNLSKYSMLIADTVIIRVECCAHKPQNTLDVRAFRRMKRLLMCSRNTQ